MEDVLPRVEVTCSALASSVFKELMRRRVSRVLLEREVVKTLERQQAKAWACPKTAKDKEYREQNIFFQKEKCNFE